MTFLITLLMLITLAVSLMLLLQLTRDQRSRELLDRANQLGAEYSGLAILDRDLRNADFEIFFRGQFRHVRNQLAGTHNSVSYKLMDYSMIQPDKVVDQTLTFIICPSSRSGNFCISRQKPLKKDAFMEDRQNALLPCRHPDLPAWSREYRLEAEKPHALAILLNGPFGDWLQQHPNLEVELSGNLLLVYRPGFLMEADQIPAALEHITAARDLLTDEKKPPEGGFQIH